MQKGEVPFTGLLPFFVLSGSGALQPLLADPYPAPQRARAGDLMVLFIRCLVTPGEEDGPEWKTDYVCRHDVLFSQL